MTLFNDKSGDFGEGCVLSRKKKENLFDLIIPSCLKKFIIYF